jgi:hypothetical protein
MPRFAGCCVGSASWSSGRWPPLIPLHRGITVLRTHVRAGRFGAGREGDAAAAVADHALGATKREAGAAQREAARAANRNRHANHPRGIFVCRFWKFSWSRQHRAAAATWWRASEKRCRTNLPPPTAMGSRPDPSAGKRMCILQEGTWSSKAFSSPRPPPDSAYGKMTAKGWKVWQDVLDFRKRQE